MKKIVKVSMLAAVMLAALTACSYVFNADITGTLVDGTGNAIPNVEVYAYLSRSERDSAYDSYKGGVFSDASAPHGTTNTTGAFVVPTLRWESSNPLFGKDGDSNTVYFIFFSKDYGINRSEGFNLQSDATNPVTVNANWKRATTDSSVTVNFVETPSGLPLTGVSDISFDYSYNDGYQDITYRGTTSSQTGSALLDISYKSAPVITITDINLPSGYTLADTDSAYTVDMAKDNSIDIKVQNLTKNVVLSFRDASTSANTVVPAAASFSYSYAKKNGTTAEGTVTAGADGTAVIAVEFTDTDTPVVISITNFDSTDDEWSAVGVKTSAESFYTPSDELSGKLTVSYGTKTTIAADVNLRRNFITIPSAGMSGHAVVGDSFYTDEGIIGSAADNGRKLTVSYTNPKTSSSETLSPTANTRKEPSSSTDFAPSASLNNGYFTGLAAGEKIYLTYAKASDTVSTATTLTITGVSGNTAAIWKFDVTNKTVDSDFANMQLLTASSN